MMLPALCLRSSPTLFNAGLSCALPADRSSAAARPRRALLPGWGCCVGPRSIGGPGLPRARLISSDLWQGSVGWQPVKCHFALSRSRFNPFSPSFSPGGKRVPGQVAPDPVSSGWDARVPGAAALTAAGAGGEAAELCRLKTRRRRRCSEHPCREGPGSEEAGERSGLPSGSRQSCLFLVQLSPLPGSLLASAWQEQTRGHVNRPSVTMLSAGPVTGSVPSA